MSQANYFNRKAVVSGNLVEVYEYERTQFFSFIKDSFLKRHNSLNDCSNTDEYINRDKRDYKKEVLDRARLHVKRIISANANQYKKSDSKDTYAKWITLTFSEKEIDLDYAKKQLDTFHKRLKRKFSISPAYVGTHEFTARGKPHFHMVYFNLPKVTVDDMRALWGNGAVNINRINGSIEEAYTISNYMFKDYDRSKRSNKSSYIRSRNLNEPIHIRHDLNVAKFMNLAEKACVWSGEFHNENTGTIQYKAYDLKLLTGMDERALRDILTT